MRTVGLFLISLCLASLVALTMAAMGRGLPAGSIGFNTGPKIVTMATGAYEATGVSNAAFIQKNQLATYNGSQYMCYYDTSLNVKIAVRNLTTNAVTTYTPTGITGPPNDDVHRVCGIALDTNGFIHFVIMPHGSALNYYRSNNSADPSAFTSHLPLVNSTVESANGYPMFIKNPSTGALYLVFHSYPNGGTLAGDGDMYFYSYSTSTQTWSAPSGTGTNGIIISGNTCVSSTNYNAYLNGIPKWDGSGNLWFQWQFLGGTGGCPPTGNQPAAQNEYLMGWTGSGLKDSTGAALTAPVTFSTAPSVFTIPSTVGLIDQADFAIDQSSGKFYIGESHQDGNSQYQSYVLTNYSGSWVENAITSFSSSTALFPYCSPSGGGEQPTMLVKSGTAFAIYPNAYLLGFGPPTTAWKSSNGFSSFTSEVVMQSMNPNNAVAFDPDRLASGIASTAFENWTQGYGVSCSYPIPDTGTMYVIDWTIQ